ncbi:MAG: winged helix-turn-helix domain-containing protein [Aeromonas sp.]
MKANLPGYEAMMPAVLKVLADGAARPLRELFERVYQHYAFTPEQLVDTLPSGRQIGQSKHPRRRG